MPRYVEYEAESGRILSFINATIENAQKTGRGNTKLLEVPEHFICDPLEYIVCDSLIIKKSSKRHSEHESEHEHRKKLFLTSVKKLLDDFFNKERR